MRCGVKKLDFKTQYLRSQDSTTFKTLKPCSSALALLSTTIINKYKYLGLKEENLSLLEETECGIRLDIGWPQSESWGRRDFFFLSLSHFLLLATVG